MDPTPIPLQMSKINRNAHTQARAQLDQAALDDYCEAIRDNKPLPPIKVFRRGSSYWIGDGWHRFHAYDRCGMDTIPADIEQGDERDALMYAAGSNHAHGVRRTAADKRLAVEIVLKDREGKTWSDRLIAEHCHVSHEFVRRIRKDATPFDHDLNGDDDQLSTVDSSHIGDSGKGTDPPAVERTVGKDRKSRPARKKDGPTPAPDPKPAAAKGGKEKTSPQLRKECKKAFAALVRQFDVALTDDGVAYSTVVAAELEAITAKLTPHWGRTLK